MGISVYSFGLCVTFGLYYLLSQLIFDKVFETSKVVIDEEFHLPQGLEYCNFSFNNWNQKITTLPGLYLISTLLLGPFGACTIYWLRFVNLLASIVNLLLVYSYLTLFTCQNRWKNLFSSINLVLLPPLYFFTHLYYTDVLSVTFVLLHIILSKSGKHILSSVTGMFSVVIRQTNIVWVLMTFGNHIIKEVFTYSSIKKSKLIHKKQEISFNDLMTILKKDVKNLSIFKKIPANVWLDFSCYAAVLVCFGLFVIINGSIVVGDKSAHTASIHFPQIFYFSLFCLVFAGPYFVSYSTEFCHFILKKKTLSLTIVLVFATVICCNTVIHPYLLADNRHYMFYIWNRFYAKYFWFKYLTIPIYYFSFYGMYKLWENNNDVPIVITSVSIMLSLILQKLIEIRYFLIPYIILRINLKSVKLWQLATEFIIYLLINALTFNIFFTKDIYWSDFSYTQKLIW